MEEMKALLIAIRQGNNNAREDFIRGNLRLVLSVIQRFNNRGENVDDLFQVGCIGLMKAIDNFDLSQNVKFSTYAVPMIIGEIKRFIRDDGIIKVSRNVKSLARKLHFDKEQLTKKLDREPTIEELSQFSGVDKEEILFAIESSASMQYLYDTIHQDDGAPVLLIDKLSEKGEDDSDMINRIALKEALRSLDSKARQIIMLRYFKEKTQVQVAKMLGISQVQVSRIEKKVLDLMKQKLQE